MISVNELRIGSWVEYKAKYKQIASIKSFSPNENFVKFIGLQSNALVSCKEINPIEIEVSHMEQISNLAAPELAELLLNFCEEEISIGDKKYAVNYVHQLQKVYFLLMNQELNIQP